MVDLRSVDDLMPALFLNGTRRGELEKEWDKWQGESISGVGRVDSIVLVFIFVFFTFVFFIIIVITIIIIIITTSSSSFIFFLIFES